MYAPATSRPQRFVLQNRLPNGVPSTIAADVGEGLRRPVKALPPKYFYDDRGSKLFDLICDLPEYYPTRTEQALLEAISGELMAAVRPTDLIELGSGAARKTRVLLDAAEATSLSLRYVPFDVSARMLERSARALLDRYPWLTIHGVVGDYEHDLKWLPEGARRLVVFLGGTIGNFLDPEATRLLSRVARQLRRGDHLLLGADLVKDTAILHAAYNDAAGITAEFNRNMLRVINRELDGDFDPGSFEHVAFYDEQKAQIEMHLRSTSDQTVNLRALNLKVHFSQGETVQTEVSRKFTRQTVSELLERSGFRLQAWYTPPNDYFALALAAVA